MQKKKFKDGKWAVLTTSAAGYLALEISNQHSIFKKGIQEQSNTTTRFQCHEINFQNKLNLKDLF